MKARSDTGEAGRKPASRIAAFGLSPYFRISYATGEQELASALQRIADVCGKLAEAD